MLMAELYVLSKPVNVVLTTYLPFDIFSNANDPSADEIDPLIRLESEKFKSNTLAFATVLSNLSTIIPCIRDWAINPNESTWQMINRNSPYSFRRSSILVV